MTRDILKLNTILILLKKYFSEFLNIWDFIKLRFIFWVSYTNNKNPHDFL